MKKRKKGDGNQLILKDSLKKRLNKSFAKLSIIVGIVLIFGLISFIFEATIVNKFYDEAFTSSVYSQKSKVYIIAIQNNINNALATDFKSDKALYAEKAKENIVILMDSLEKLEQSFHNDELIFDTPEEEIEEVKKMVTEIMENTCKLEVPLKVEIDYGSNWYNVK